jgi:hypothetical protein
MAIATPHVRAGFTGLCFQACVVAAAALLLGACGSERAPTASAATASGLGSGPRIDLKVLLLHAGSAPEIDAWKATLTRLGTPFDDIDLAGATFTADTLSDGAGHARYNAVILGRPSDLTEDQGAILASFESSFGIRQIVAWTWGWGGNGLGAPFGYDGWPDGYDGSPVVGTLTAAGRGVFPYLAGSVPFDNQWGVLELPDPSAQFETLVEGPGGAALVGIHTLLDGREEMVTTIEYTVWDGDQKALLEGQLAWATRGVYLGYWRNYLSMHFDDVLLGDERWSATLHDVSEDLSPIRMTPADVSRAVAWSRANDLRLHLVFNGQGATAAETGNGVRKGQQDALTDALLASRSSFGWISHTWSHADLDTADLQAITTEIKKNVAWATANGVAIAPAELVTGGHAGPGNPAFEVALARTGVTCIASDASVDDAVRTLGTSLVVPRHPTNLFYNVGTRSEQLDEFNWIYRDDPWVNAPVTWTQYVNITAGQILGAVMANDPRPHFAHQNNLAEDGTFYDVADAVLQGYRAWFSVPLVQPTMSEAGAQLVNAKAWRAALDAGQVTAYIAGGAVHVDAKVAVSVPVTGTTVGTLYGGLVSGWAAAAAGRPLVLPLAR